MTCVRLIEKVQNEWYGTEYMDYHEPRFNWDDHENHPGSKKIAIEEDPNNSFDDYFNKYPRIYKQVINNPNPLFDNNTKSNIAMNIARTNERRASKLLFNILRDNIQKWWD